MAWWEWMLVGIGGWLLIAVLVAFVLARVLDRIGREVTALHDLLDAQAWSTRPLARDRKSEEKDAEKVDDELMTRASKSARRHD